MGFIYKITNLINGKVYVGFTEKTIQERWLAHTKKAKVKTNRYLYDAMNKYGYENFSITEVDSKIQKLYGVSVAQFRRQILNGDVHE